MALMQIRSFWPIGIKYFTHILFQKKKKKIETCEFNRICSENEVSTIEPNCTRTKSAVHYYIYGYKL